MTHAPATTTRKDEPRHRGAKQIDASRRQSQRAERDRRARWMQTRAGRVRRRRAYGSIRRGESSGGGRARRRGTGRRRYHRCRNTSPPQGSRIQAKLEVGGVDDPEEHEADSLASAALADSSKAPSAGGGTSPRSAARQGAPQGGCRGRRPACRDGRLRQRDRPPARSRDARLLRAALRADLGAVRIHDDPSTRMEARAMRRAFTVGADIGFADGELSPHTSDGRFLWRTNWRTYHAATAAYGATSRTTSRDARAFRWPPQPAARPARSGTNCPRAIRCTRPTASTGPNRSRRGCTG